VKFLPIAERELRVAARRPATYWLRFSVAGGLLVLASWFYLTSRRMGVTDLGRVLFYTLIGGLGAYSLSVGVRTTADCLSEEKREGTLGFLFLTNLKGYDIVLGKLLANSLAVFYGVLGVLPLLAVPILMGGVTGAEFGRLAFTVLNTLFLSLSIGMLASAVCLRAKTATAVAMLLLILLVVGGPGLGLLEYRARGWHGTYFWPFLVLSPVFPFFAGAEFLYRSSIGDLFYWSAGSIHLAAWGCLGLASRVLRHKWQDKPATAAALQRRSWREQMLEGDRGSREAFRTWLLDQNAFYWLAARPRHRVIWAWTPLAAATVFWIWGAIKIGNDWFNPGMYLATAFLLSVVLRSMMGAEAGRRLLEDRRAGALELLLATPLGVPEILRGQWLALRRQFLVPVIVTICLCGVMWLAGFDESRGSDRPGWFWIGLAGVFMFFADTAALVWMGMWLGLSVKNPRHAFGGAIAPILALPWVATALVMTAIAFVPYPIRQHWRPDILVWVLWFGFSMAADLGFGWWAWHNLHTRFREVAAQRYQVKPSWWQRLTGRGTGENFT
jgi:ABC-type transport system involved in cytochrome c biogenesis permease component